MEVVVEGQEGQPCLLRSRYIFAVPAVQCSGQQCQVWSSLHPEWLLPPITFDFVQHVPKRATSPTGTTIIPTDTSY